jgi:hypothetical protein
MASAWATGAQLYEDRRLAAMESVRPRGLVVARGSWAHRRPAGGVEAAKGGRECTMCVWRRQPQGNETAAAANGV